MGKSANEGDTGDGISFNIDDIEIVYKKQDESDSKVELTEVNRQNKETEAAAIKDFENLKSRDLSKMTDREIAEYNKKVGTKYNNYKKPHTDGDAYQQPDFQQLSSTNKMFDYNIKEVRTKAKQMVEQKAFWDYKLFFKYRNAEAPVSFKDTVKKWWDVGRIIVLSRTYSYKKNKIVIKNADRFRFQNNWYILAEANLVAELKKLNYKGE